jgi:lipopolysaccharide transport system ATP-binding protein
VSDSVIIAEGVSKRYRLTHLNKRSRGQGATLSEKVQRLVAAPWNRFRSSERVGETKEDFWALKDVNFAVKRGEIVGLIGRNGAGKSTMLKILSRITDPTTGQIRIQGRVASLLEVGTGFHPELTGRENVYLNGAIMGMKRHEIRAKFDEIVNFAEVERFLDTPVKFYSSGMYVRLAFAVAAHLEPDILIVDEVLAVGDMAFQKKCLAQMESTTRQGRTVLLVSHNMPTVLSLCSRAILLAGGKVLADGPASSVLETYQNAFRDGAATLSSKKTPCRILRAWVGDDPNSPMRHVSLSQPFAFHIEYCVEKADGRTYVPYFQLHTDDGHCLFQVNPEQLTAGPAGTWRATCTIPAWLLNSGSYHASLYINAFTANNCEGCSEEPMALSFTVSEDQTHPGRYAYAGRVPGSTWPRFDWKVSCIEER